MGLLLLRATVGVCAGVQGVIYLTRSHPTFATWVAGLLAVACGACLLIGFLTSVAGVLVGLGGAGIALSWLPVATPNLPDYKLAIVYSVIIAVAIVLLGPGAYSLDARLFGRREVIIPRASHSSKS